jgi:predicted nucleotidyltransferase
MQSQIIILNKELKNFISLNEIDDIILFGSYLKGKEKPKDIDLLIIFKEKINKKIEFEIKTKLNKKFEINSIIKKELNEDNFIAKEGLYLEGYSFKNKKMLNEILGFNSFAFVKYDLKNIKGSKRIRFYYALMGRNNNGFITTIKAKRFSDNVIICNYSDIFKLEEFFINWNINYVIIPSLIPKRLSHILIK